jgi:hypothetical protein
MTYWYDNHDLSLFPDSFPFLLGREQFFTPNGAASPGMEQSPLGMNLGIK